MFLVATNRGGGHDGGGVVNYLQPIHTYNICCTNPCFFWREEDVAHGMYRAWRIAFCFGGRRPRIFGGEYYSVQKCFAVVSKSVLVAFVWVGAYVCFFLLSVKIYGCLDPIPGPPYTWTQLYLDFLARAASSINNPNAQK